MADGEGRVMDGSQRLDGKSAVVVGAAQGIGRAVALCFADAGAHVLCADIDEAGAKATAAQAEKDGGKAAAARIDVTKSASMSYSSARRRTTRRPRCPSSRRACGSE